MPGITETHSGRLAGTAFLFIGTASLGCGASLVFISTERLLALLLVGAPACITGTIALLSGAAGLATRIELSRDTLALSVPTWRGCPLPPIVHRRIPWNKVTKLRHRKEIYHLLPGQGLPMEVDCYAIETTDERVVLAGRFIPRLASTMRAISDRSGQPLQEDPPTPAGIWASLMKGPPAWR